DGIRDFHVTGVQTCALPIYDFYIEAASLFVEGAQIGRLRLRPRSSVLSFDNPEHQDEIEFLGRVVGYYKQDAGKKFLAYGQLMQIGRASCRERAQISLVAVT